MKSQRAMTLKQQTEDIVEEAQKILDDERRDEPQQEMSEERIFRQGLEMAEQKVRDDNVQVNGEYEDRDEEITDYSR